MTLPELRAVAEAANLPGRLDYIDRTSVAFVEAFSPSRVLALLDAVEPLVALAKAIIVDDGSPDFRKWVTDSADWTVIFSFAGQSVTLGQLRALAALDEALK